MRKVFVVMLSAAFGGYTFIAVRLSVENAKIAAQKHLTEHTFFDDPETLEFHVNDSGNILSQDSEMGIYVISEEKVI